MAKNYNAVRHNGALAREYLNINWCLTNICNFNCSYCPETLHNGTNKGLEPDKVTSAIDKIINSYPEKKAFFEFTGGEVTYYKNFLDVASYTKSKGAELGIISNGKRELSFWQKLKPYLDHICLSYHPENKYIQRFTEVVRYLNEEITVHVNIMMRPDLFDDCMKVAELTHSIHGISLALQPLYENMTGKKFKYSPSQLRILESQCDVLPHKKPSPHPKKYKAYRGPMRFEIDDGYHYDIYSTPEILAKGLNNWKGWHCYAGLENLVIDMAGNVRRAWCQDPKVLLGNIHTGFSLPTSPIVCSIENCHCGFDMMCTKVRKNNAQRVRLP